MSALGEVLVAAEARYRAQAVDDGLVLGGPNPYEARLAEAIRVRFASIDLIRFT